MRRVFNTDIGTKIEAAAAPVIDQLRDQYTAASHATGRRPPVGIMLAAPEENDAFIDEVHSAVAPKEIAPALTSELPKDNHKKPKSR